MMMHDSFPMALHSGAGLGGARRVFYVGALVMVLILLAAIEALAQVHGAPTTPGAPGMPTTSPPNAPGRPMNPPPNAPGRPIDIVTPGAPGLPTNPPATNAPGLPSSGNTNAPGLPSGQ